MLVERENKNKSAKAHQRGEEEQQSFVVVFSSSFSAVCAGLLLSSAGRWVKCVLAGWLE